MTRARATFPLALKVVAGSPVSNHFQPQQQTKQLIFHTGIIVTPVNCPAPIRKRFYSTQNITKRLKLITHDLTPKIDKLTLQIDPNNVTKGRPLAIILEWMLAKQKHVENFSSLYFNGGYDVLLTPVKPMHLIWPPKGAKVTAAELLLFLANNPHYDRIVVHAFSVGGYTMSEIQIQMASDLERFNPIINRVKGQLYDSIVDYADVFKGFPLGVFPHNYVLRTAFEYYMRFHLYLFEEQATKHYRAGSARFHDNLLCVPAQFFASKTDPVATIGRILMVKEDWTKKGIETFMKCWDSSPHVSHLAKHRDEYIAEFNKYLKYINMPLVIDDQPEQQLGAKS